MYRILFLLFTACLCAYAATPKLYNAIGDPIYRQMTAVEKISKIPYFKNDRAELERFVQETHAHKKLGLLYDIKRKQKTLSKDERQMYRNTLRDLEKKLDKISAIAKKALSDIIRENRAQTFRQLTRTELDVFKKDPKSLAAIKDYAKRLKHQQYLRQKREERQAENKKEAYEKMLRSAKNLNGTWKGESSDGSALTAYFEQEKLSLRYERSQKVNIYKGTYTLGDTLDFHIYKRDLIKDGISHIRRIDLERSYELLRISKKELHLRYKAESILLKR